MRRGASFFLLAAVRVVGWSDWTTPSSNALTQIRRAMELSNESGRNITAAYQACELWDQLAKDDVLPNPTIRAMCWALQASCLVRIGRDDDALVVYDKAIELQEHLQPDTRENVIVGKARSLQRLLQYEKAKQQFGQSTSANAIVGAATCALRLGDLSGAIRLLEGCNRQQEDHVVEAKAMLATLNYLERHTTNDADLSILQRAAALSPLYHWIYMLLLSDPNLSESNQSFDEIPNTSSDFLDLIVVNTCALDDPLLIHLDDKVLLHKLLSSEPKGTAQFWPQGVILPGESSRLNAWSGESSNNDLAWVCKRRAGYGSHGNVIMNTSHVLRLSLTLEDDILLQRMVEPPLLLQGRKFSLRIYVIYFISTTPEVFLSRHGLVKLAALPLKTETESNVANLRMHMTNSGREATMQQQDLKYLEQALAPTDVSFDKLWESLEKAVSRTMRVYNEKAKSLTGQDDSLAALRSGLCRLGIPKILGFDFVVDAAGSAWLVEVNRFPGLEPRDEKSDATVKQSVVQESWNMAARRKQINYQPFKVQCSVDHSDNDSLQRIDL